MGMILITKHAYQMGLRLGLENEWSFTGALILLRGGAVRGVGIRREGRVGLPGRGGDLAEGRGWIWRDGGGDLWGRRYL